MTKLIEYVKEGNLQAIQECYAKDPALNLNESDEGGMSLLVHALFRGHTEVVCWLLEQNVSTVTNDEQWSLLDYAVRRASNKSLQEYRELMQLLKEKNIIPQDFSPLWLAAAIGDDVFLQTQMPGIASGQLLTTTVCGFNPLMIAIANGNLNFVKAILSKLSFPAIDAILAPIPEGLCARWNGFHLATHHNRADILDFLMSKCEGDQLLIPVPNDAWRGGYNIIHFAERECMTLILKKLQQNNKDLPEILSRCVGGKTLTILHIATSNLMSCFELILRNLENKQVENILLRYTDGLEVHKNDFDSLDVVGLSIYFGNLNALKASLDCLIDQAIVTLQEMIPGGKFKGWRLLQLAAYRSSNLSDNIVEFLLSKLGVPKLTEMELGKLGVAALTEMEYVIPAGEFKGWTFVHFMARYSTPYLFEKILIYLDKCKRYDLIKKTVKDDDALSLILKRIKDDPKLEQNYAPIVWLLVNKYKFNFIESTIDADLKLKGEMLCRRFGETINAYADVLRFAFLPIEIRLLIAVLALHAEYPQLRFCKIYLEDTREQQDNEHYTSQVRPYVSRMAAREQRQELSYQARAMTTKAELKKANTEMVVRVQTELDKAVQDHSVKKGVFSKEKCDELISAFFHTGLRTKGLRETLQKVLAPSVVNKPAQEPKIVIVVPAENSINVGGVEIQQNNERGLTLNIFR